MRSHYETLGVSRSVQPEQIKRSYRALVKRFHPDLYPVGSPEQAEAAARLKEIISAYAVLSNSSKRKMYDAKLEKPASFATRPMPEYCHRCGRPTLYWQIGRMQPFCDECGQRVPRQRQ